MALEQCRDLSSVAAAPPPPRPPPRARGLRRTSRQRHRPLAGSGGPLATSAASSPPPPPRRHRLAPARDFLAFRTRALRSAAEAARRSRLFLRFPPAEVPRLSLCESGTAEETRRPWVCGSGRWIPSTRRSLRHARSSPTSARTQNGRLSWKPDGLMDDLLDVGRQRVQQPEFRVDGLRAARRRAERKHGRSRQAPSPRLCASRTSSPRPTARQSCRGFEFGMWSSGMRSPVMKRQLDVAARTVGDLSPIVPEPPPVDADDDVALGAIQDLRRDSPAESARRSAPRRPQAAGLQSERRANKCTSPAPV